MATPPRPFSRTCNQARQKTIHQVPPKVKPTNPKTKPDAGSAAPASNPISIPTPGSTLYRIIGMINVPHRDHIIARLADILGIDEFAPKSVLLIHCPRDALVRPDVHPVHAVQADTERIDSGSRADRASVQQQAGEGFDLAFLHVLDHAERYFTLGKLDCARVFVSTITLAALKTPV
ncbi:MAG: hypothetical protein GY845_31270 [Planctomycetes bacterium]|nr:hypothetical protein [Planctomycetota bacterium]